MTFDLSILATVLLLFTVFYLKAMLREWNYKITIREEAQAKIPRVPSNYHNQNNMKTNTEKPEPISIMNYLLEDARKIRLELDRRTDEAKHLKEWIDENPEAPERQIQDVRNQLMESLQCINDLVCKLNPRPQIIVK